MKKMSANHTKFTSLLILAILLVAPITTPTVADAQRVGTQATRPTASITVNGVQNVSTKAGSRAPVVRWVSKNGTTHKTILKVNNASLCGVRNGQVWGSGKNAQGSASALAPTQARVGCVLTFVYEVTNRLGQKASDTAVVRYIAADPAPTKPKPTITNPNTGNTGTSTSTTTTDTYSKLKLLTPNGGERWMLNSDNTIITWEPEPHRDGMVAYLEKKQGNSFVTIGKVIEGRKGSIQWFGEITIGDKEAYATPGDNYYMRIVDTTTGETDRSDAPFTILAADTFEVNLQPADKDNYLEVIEPQQVRLNWNATAPGVSSSAISCSLSIFDNSGSLVSQDRVTPNDTQDIWVQPPTTTFNGGGGYTVAHISCTSPLGTRGDYVHVVQGNASNTPDVIETFLLSKSATVDLAEFTGDIEKGIYEFEIAVQAGDHPLYIPDFTDFPAVIIKITDGGIPFTGSNTTYISESDAQYDGLARRYYIPAHQERKFTFRIELDPTGMSSAHQYGIRLFELNYGKSSATIDQIYMFPNDGTFETNKVTIASAIPEGEITQTVAQGAAGEDVSRVQAALKKAGLFNEEITGYFGSITRAAVKAFQREHALENVGAVGPQTMSLLNQILGN